MKTAVVTGGASGTGRAVAQRLRSDGFRVAVIDLSPAGGGFGQVADVTDRAQFDAAVAAIRQEFGPILVPVNGLTKALALAYGPSGITVNVAAACSFFVSEEAGDTTGQILGVNGGRNT